MRGKEKPSRDFFLFFFFFQPSGWLLSLVSPTVISLTRRKRKNIFQNQSAILLPQRTVQFFFKLLRCVNSFLLRLAYGVILRYNLSDTSSRRPHIFSPKVCFVQLKLACLPFKKSNMTILFNQFHLCSVTYQKDAFIISRHK